MGTVGSLRSYFFTKHLLAKDFRVTVAVPKFTPIKHKWGLQQENVNKILLPNLDYRVVSKKKKFRTSYPSDSIFWRLKEAFTFNLLFGEGGLFYVVYGVFKLNHYIRKRSVNTLFTSYRPLSDIFIGYILKGLNHNIKWICDFRDIPVDTLHKNYLFGKIARWCYGTLIRKADFVTSVTQGVGRSLPASRKFWKLSNGCNYLPVNDNGLKSEDQKIRFTYTGSLHRYQDLTPLIGAIEELIAQRALNPDKVVFEYAGKDSERFLKFFEHSKINLKIQDHGIIPYLETRKLQTWSNFNIMLSWNLKNNQGIITGKFFDYLSQAVPIICISKGPVDDEIKSIFNKYCLGFYFSSAENSIDEIKDFILRAMKGNWNPNDKAIRNDFGWDRATDQLIELISA